MARVTNPIPQGYHTVTPYLTVNDATRALDFYRRAFGAQEVSRMAGPQGKIGHAEIKIGDSMIMISDETPMSGCRAPQSLGGTTVNICLYLADVDAAYKQALAAGANSEATPENMFWGDRYAKVRDPFGHSWSLATHIEDVAPQEIERRGKEYMAKMGRQAGHAG